MKLPNFLKPSQQAPGAPILTVDFGTSELRAAVCKKEDEIMKVLSLVKIPYPSEIIDFGCIVNYKKAEQVLETGFQEATVSLEKNNYPQGVVFTIWGETLRVQTTTGKLNFSSGERAISQQKKKEILQKLSEAALIEVSQQWVNQTGREDLEIEEHESFVSKIKLNDQYYKNLEDLETALPSGEKYELGLNQTAIYIDKKQREIFDRLAKSVGLPLINLVFGAQALLEIQNIQANQPIEDAVILDIDGRTTTIALIFENNLWTSRVLGVGADDFISLLALNLDVSFEEALQKVLNFVNNDLNEEEKVKIDSLLGDVLEVWCQGLELALSKIEGIKVYPKLFLLGGGGVLFPKIKEFLETHSWSRSLAFTAEPRFEVLSLDQFSELFEFGNVNYDKVRDFWLFMVAARELIKTLKH